jgi:hypothetical protein
MRKGNARTPQVVKWLLNHRKHGYYWDSTRDTASVIAALSTHLQASGEKNADYDLEILVDGVVKKKVHVDKKNLYAVNGDLTLEGNEVGGGKHTVTIRRSGEGAVYFPNPQKWGAPDRTDRPATLSTTASCCWCGRGMPTRVRCLVLRRPLHARHASSRRSARSCFCRRLVVCLRAEEARSGSADDRAGKDDRAEGCPRGPRRR